MKNVLSNLKLLKYDMENNGWIIDCFKFDFKSKDYLVLVKLLDKVNDKSIPSYVLVQLEFLNCKNFDDSLQVYANSSSLIVSLKDFCEFFDIKWSDNLGQIIEQFKIYLSSYIPPAVNQSKSKIEKMAMIHSLDKADSQDPNRLYCFAVRRNPPRPDGKLGRRSQFNDNKTRILRSTLHEKLKDDSSLSFKYSLLSEDEKSDEEIISNWVKNSRGI